MAPVTLKDVESRVDATPHPITAQPIQILGGKSLEVMVAGTGKSIYPGYPKSARWCPAAARATHVGDEERRVCPVKQFTCRVTSEHVLRKALQPRVA